ncbi:MAG: type II toxin-antitoxin system MqsA family antitoxin [Candidatus Binataceae bacterium]
MKWVICKHGQARAGKTTVTLERRGATLVVKSVPGPVSDNCGEAYVDENVTHQLLETAEVALRAGVHVDVREFGGPPI